MRSIRLRIAAKEMPGSAAFVAPAAAFAVDRPVAIRPPGRNPVAVSLQRVGGAPGLQRPTTTTSRSEKARLRAAAVDGEGSTRGGVSRAPLVPSLARSMRDWDGRSALKLERKSPILISGVGRALRPAPVS